MKAQTASPITERQIQQVRAAARECAVRFLTCSQVMLTLWSENHSLGTTNLDELFTLHINQPKF